MALDLGRTVLGHNANHDAADDWDQDDPRSQMVIANAGEIGRPAVKEKQIRE